MALESAGRYPCLRRAGTVVLMIMYLRFDRYNLVLFDLIRTVLERGMGSDQRDVQSSLVFLGSTVRKQRPSGTGYES